MPLSRTTTLGRLDLEVMAMKGYSVFPKEFQTLLEPSPPIVSCHIMKLVEGVLSLRREAIGVLYRPID